MSAPLLLLAMLSCSGGKPPGGAPEPSATQVTGSAPRPAASVFASAFDSPAWRPHRSAGPIDGYVLVADRSGAMQPVGLGVGDRLTSCAGGAVDTDEALAACLFGWGTASTLAVEVVTGQDVARHAWDLPDPPVQVPEGFSPRLDLDLPELRRRAGIEPLDDGFRVPRSVFQPVVEGVGSTTFRLAASPQGLRWEVHPAHAGPLALVGLEPGDRLLGVEDRPVLDPEDIQYLYEALFNEDIVDMQVERDGAEHRFRVEVTGGRLEAGDEIPLTLDRAVIDAGVGFRDGSITLPVNLVTKLADTAPWKPLGDDDQGVRLSGLRPGSALHVVGLRSGHILRTIDGHPAASYSNLAEALADGSAQVELERKGNHINLAYRTEAP